MTDVDEIEVKIGEIDKQKKELEERSRILEDESISLEIEKGKLQGHIFDSPELLRCEKHPDARFLLGHRRLEWRDVEIYYCDECDKKKLIGEWNSIKNVAYTCPRCGIVLGRMSENRYDDIGILSGSAGVEFKCVICGRLMGRRVFVVS